MKEVLSKIFSPAFTKLRFFFDRDYYKSISIKEFCHAHPELLIIIGDPKTDRLFAANHNKYVNVVIKDMKGKRTEIVKSVLSHSLFKKSIDSFIISIVEALHIPLPRANQFFQFVDAAIFNIAKSLRDDRAAKREPSQPKTTPKAEGIPSPFYSGAGDRSVSN